MEEKEERTLVYTYHTVLIYICNAWQYFLNEIMARSLVLSIYNHLFFLFSIFYCLGVYKFWQRRGGGGVKLTFCLLDSCLHITVIDEVYVTFLHHAQLFPFYIASFFFFFFFFPLSKKKIFFSFFFFFHHFTTGHQLGFFFFFFFSLSLIFDCTVHNFFA